MKPTKILGAVGLLIALILITFYRPLIQAFLNLMSALGNDGDLQPLTIFRLRGLVEFGIMVLLGVSILLILDVFAWMERLVEMDRLKRFLLVDPLSTKRHWPRYLLAAGVGGSVMLQFHMLILGVPSHEGMIEHVSTALFAISAVAFFIAAFKLGKIDTTRTSRRLIRVTFFALAAFFIWVTGEEISWGQQIFKWDSFGVFLEHNVQQETNLHNFFNRSFDYIYAVGGMGIFLLLSLLLAFGKPRNEYWFQLLVPHPALWIPCLFLAGSCFSGENETFEAVLSVIVFLYSCRIFYCLMFPASSYSEAERGVLAEVAPGDETSLFS